MTDRYESRATTHAPDCWSWGPKHYECAVREIETLRAEVEKLRNLRADAIHECALANVRAAQAEAEPRLFLAGEDDAWCAECGAKLETVRPGKHQHPTCSQAQPLTDEALLRQALGALGRYCKRPKGADFTTEVMGLPAPAKRCPGLIEPTRSFAIAAQQGGAA